MPSWRMCRLFDILVAAHANLAYNFIDDVMRACFSFLINSSDIFPDDSQEEQIHAGKKCDDQDDGGESLRRMSPEFSVQRIQGIKDREADCYGTQNRSGSQWNNRKGKDTVQCQFEKLEGAVFGSPCRTG